MITVEEGILRDNNKCEETLLSSLGYPIETPVTNNTFTDITLDQMTKPSATMFGVFIKIRLCVDLTERCIIATKKVNHIEVRRGEIDEKTKDPLMLEQAHQVRHTVQVGALPVTVTNDEVELNEVNILQPTCLTFCDEIDSFDSPNLEWYRDITCNIKSIEYNKTILLENMNLDCEMLLNEDVKELHSSFLSRLPQFVANHIPAKRINCIPVFTGSGNHFATLCPNYMLLYY